MVDHFEAGAFGSIRRKQSVAGEKKKGKTFCLPLRQCAVGIG
jgi:hypothetical protein